MRPAVRYRASQISTKHVSAPEIVITARYDAPGKKDPRGSHSATRLAGHLPGASMALLFCQITVGVRWKRLCELAPDYMDPQVRMGPESWMRSLSVIINYSLKA